MPVNVGPLRISLLGPIEVTRGDVAVRLGGAKPRLVLALLALQPGRVVSVDALTDALWHDAPPATASASLQVHVSALRRAMDVAGDPSCIVNRAPGYALDVEPLAVDVTEFEQLCDEGRRLMTDGRFVEAAEHLRRAEGLWRGAAMADLAGEHAVIGPVATLDEARLMAAESRIGADLGRGAHADVVAELRALVAEHPLREDLWAALMVALYRSGRQSDAARGLPGGTGHARRRAGHRSRARAAGARAGGPRPVACARLVADIDGGTCAVARHDDHRGPRCRP